MRRAVLLLLACAATALVLRTPSARAQAADGIPVGPATLTFPVEPDLKVWTYRAARFGPDSPILFVMHGNGREATSYRDAWAPHAEAAGALLLVPEFDEGQFDERVYHQGNVLDAEGRATPPKRWTWNAIERAFDRARALTGSRRERYLIYGHSAGGQFVHRMIELMPHLRVERAVSANAGWYTLPLAAEAYPYGLGGLKVDEAQLRRAFDRPLTILLGDQDIDPQSRALRRTPEAMRQGAYRLARGRFFYDTAQHEAARLGRRFGWSLGIVPGVAHSNAGMAASAALILFGARE